MRSQRDGKDNANMKYCRLVAGIEHLRQDESYITLN